MTTITCPQCGCEFEPEQKIIHLKEKLHFNMDMLIFRRGVYRAWRKSGAALIVDSETVARVSTKEIASEIGFSEKHVLRGLRILEATGEIEQVGAKSGWRITEKIVPFVRSAV